MAGERFRDCVFASAGTRPGARADAENAIQMLRVEFAIDRSGHAPQDVHNVNLDGFDLIVAIDDDRGPTNVAQEVRKLTRRKVVGWRIRDPFGRGDEYKPCALKIIHELGRLSMPPPS